MNSTEQKLALEVEHYLNLARGNYFTVWAMYILSVGASVLATVFAATGSPEKVRLAVLAAVPAIVLLVNNTFKFNARSQWHYEKKRRLDSLLRLSEAGAAGTTPPEVAAEWNRIDEDMDKRWPGWGELPKAPIHDG
jgi:hypothetical protein